MIRKALSPYIYVTQVGIAWTRYWLDSVELMCTLMESDEDYG